MHQGEMIYVQENGLMLFLGSPSVLNLEDLTRYTIQILDGVKKQQLKWWIVFRSRRGLYLSDIPLHDGTRDLVLLSEKFEAEYKLTRDLEYLTDQLQQTKVELEREKQKTDTLLYSVLPPTVANELRHGRPVAARRYERVTLLFSGIVGFRFGSIHQHFYGKKWQNAVVYPPQWHLRTEFRCQRSYEGCQDAKCPVHDLWRSHGSAKKSKHLQSTKTIVQKKKLLFV